MINPLPPNHDLYGAFYPPIETLGEFANCLRDLGWRIGEAKDLNCPWTAYIRSSTGQKCECNEREVQFILLPHPVFGGAVVVDICVIGEADGEWWEFKCYGMKLDTVLPNLQRVCAGLLAAWNAIPRADMAEFSPPQEVLL